MKCWIFFNADGWNADGDTSIADRYGEVAKLMISFFHNSVNELGLQPRIGPVQQGPGEGSREGSAEGLGGFGAEPGQVQQGSERVGEGSGEGLGMGGFGAEPGQVQQGSGEGSGEGLGGFGPVRFNKVPKKVPGEGLRLWFRFNRVPEKVRRRSREGSGEGLGGFGAGAAGQVQQGSEEGSRRRSGRLWCRARSGSTGFGEGSRKGSGEGFGEGMGGSGAAGQVQQGSEEGSRRRSAGSTGFRRRFGEGSRKVSGEGSGEGLGGFGGRFPEKVWEALVQNQVKFNRVPEKVRRKFPEAWAQSQVSFGSETTWEASGFGAEPGQVQRDLQPFLFTETQLRCFQRLASQHASERFEEIKCCGC